VCGIGPYQLQRARPGAGKANFGSTRSFGGNSRIGVGDVFTADELRLALQHAPQCLSRRARAWRSESSIFPSCGTDAWHAWYAAVRRRSCHSAVQNVANADTPNYRPNDLVEPKFACPPRAGPAAIVRTDAAHLAGSNAAPGFPSENRQYQVRPR